MPPTQQMIEQFFTYGIPPTAVLGNAVANQIIVIGNDADFQAIWWISNQTGTFTLRVSDGGSGRPFMNTPINNANILGTANNPFPMLPPYVFKRAQSIQLDITDTSGNPNTIQIAFVGKKIFANAAAGSAGVVVQG